MAPVRLHLQCPDAPAAAVRAARLAVGRAMARLGVPRATEVALVLMDDHCLQALNRQYRGMDEPTDVLSFAADATVQVSDEAPNLGDIIVSVPFARRNAAAAGWSLEAELRLLAVHGLLHLLGHEDDSPAGAAEMHRLEIELGVRPPDEAV